MERRRLRAPREDGAFFCEPRLGDFANLAALAERWAQSVPWDLLGRSFTDLRAAARREVLEQARAFHSKMNLGPVEAVNGPWLMTGHQPELFHAGVWAKSVAVGSIGARQSVQAVNLIVDDDVPKTATIRVPTRDARGVEAVSVPFESSAGEAPYEEWRIENDSLFWSFGNRVRETLGGLVPNPVIDQFWHEVESRRGTTNRIGWLLASARRAIEERKFGGKTAEAPQSLVCQTPAFFWFASHLLAHLARFQRVHNGALADYRRTNGIRSTHHPVPALQSRPDGWLEAPFWIWRDGDQRRQPLWARLRGCHIQLRAGQDTDPVADLPVCPGRDAHDAVRELATLCSQGLRLRTRALSTTLFSRLFLADLFVHGIGGAKYDELGDEVSLGFYGDKPPPYATLSQTVWLGLPVETDVAARIATTQKQLRDLAYHGENNPDLARDELGIHLASLKNDAITADISTKRTRRDRWRRLQSINQAISTRLDGKRRPLEAELAQLRSALRASDLGRSRDWSFVVHSWDRLIVAYQMLIDAGDANLETRVSV